ncbi:MAG TPA: TIGR04283 family arsenosugar biosynthesis glycosyltransferase [Smithellaceae bacterium]|jgi:rSAM/selenodomain-associated transferase 2|nr:TIGR04283 family arsenosugar biosynthesis glycosyltransferase [Smithellaceae bacterium]HOZ62701.1 TIGR04283 family arsenosugar biosynthesis glycosyltransferase [Smithellaceae bacterium]HPL68249.1 TIGR04283 family arsenosugar biosynthesis glycosyltransferase [Smithellaceae bacterium]HPL97905.1 TIGR04283 family arsenosugar biosynthesis glycosyltransferase [Smithellaceae bacterium]
MSKKISIIVPVLNEGADINKTIEHLNGLVEATGVSAEIIVVDGDPDGKTIAVIRDKSVVTTVGQTGRAAQMNKGAQIARGEIFLFLHADTRLPNEGLNLITVACGERGYKTGAFDLAIASGRRIFRLIETMANVRSHLTGIPYGDQGLFFHADYFRALGGFADVPIMEDIEIMRRVKKRGDKILFLKQTVRTSSRRWEKEGVWKCTFRNWLLASLYVLGVTPQKLARFYRVHAAG